MKKIIKNNIFGFILGGLIFGCVGAYAAVQYNAADIIYKDKTTVKTALDDLYDKSSVITKDAATFLKKTNHSVSRNDMLTSLNIFNNQNVFNEILKESNYTSYILENSIDVLDSSDLKLTSASNNNIFGSSQYTNGAINNAFSKDENYWAPKTNNSYNGEYLGYDFGKDVWVYKVLAEVSGGKQNADYVLEGSKDNETYVVIKDGLHQEGTAWDNHPTKTIIPNNYNTKYRYYRIRFTTDAVQSGSGNTVVYYLKFYAMS